MPPPTDRDPVPGHDRQGQPGVDVPATLPPHEWRIKRMFAKMVRVIVIKVLRVPLDVLEPDRDGFKSGRG